MTADKDYTLDVIILSNPATIDSGNGKPYWIFEVHVTGSDAEHDYSPTDRAYMTLTPGELPPQTEAGLSCRLRGKWTSDKAFRMTAIEPR